MSKRQQLNKRIARHSQNDTDDVSATTPVTGEPDQSCMVTWWMLWNTDKLVKVYILQLAN